MIRTGTLGGIGLVLLVLGGIFMGTTSLDNPSQLWLGILGLLLILVGLVVLLQFSIRLINSGAKPTPTLPSEERDRSYRDYQDLQRQQEATRQRQGAQEATQAGSGSKRKAVDASLRRLLGKDAKIYVDDVKGLLVRAREQKQADSLDGAMKLLEEKQRMQEQREELASSIKEIDEQRTSLSSRLARGDIDGDTYRTARDDLDLRRNEIAERLAGIDAKLYKEDYEKPVF